jgi:hypothetical protein
MSKNSRNKKKVAGPKGSGKRSVKAKDLPAKRGVRGGASNLAPTRSTTPTFGGAVLKRGEMLNLGL